MVGFMIVLPLLPFYALDLQAIPGDRRRSSSRRSPSPSCVSAPLWGRVSDRYGRRPALLIGLTASAIAYVVFGFAESLWLLFLSRLVQGAGGGTTGVAQAYVADTMRARERAQGARLALRGDVRRRRVRTGDRLLRRAPGPGGARPGGGRALPAERGVRLALAAGVAGPRGEGRAPAPAAGLAPGLDRDPPSRRAALAAALDLRHRHGGVRVADVGAGALSRRGVRARRDDHRPDLHLHRHPLVRHAERAARPDRGPPGRAVDACGSGTFALALGLVALPDAESLWAFAAVIPLVPIGTALLFPSTTSLMSRQSDPRELGITMGVAQTFAGLARVAAPLLATTAFQRLGHGAPFYLAGACVALAGRPGVPDPDQLPQSPPHPAAK